MTPLRLSVFYIVVPAKAGTQFFAFCLDPRFRGDDGVIGKTAAPMFQGRRLSGRQLGFAILQLVGTSVSPIGMVAVIFQPQPVFSSSNFMSPVIGVSAEM